VQAWPGSWRGKAQQSVFYVHKSRQFARFAKGHPSDIDELSVFKTAGVAAEG